MVGAYYTHGACLYRACTARLPPPPRPYLASTAPVPCFYCAFIMPLARPYHAPTAPPPRLYRARTMPLPRLYPDATMPPPHLYRASWGGGPTLRQPPPPSPRGLCVLAQSDACRDASRRAGRIVHPDKLEFFLLRLLRRGIAQDRAPVPNSADLTSTDPPELVGVPLLPELPPHKATNKALRTLKSVHKSIARSPASPILRLRSLYCFGLLVLDYLSGGVLFGVEDLRTHQRITDTVHLTAYRLLPWTHRSLLRLPLALGGFCPPDVSVRSLLQLLVTYLRASWGTNVLAVSAAYYVLGLQQRGDWQPEGQRMKDTLQPLHVTLHLCPTGAIRDAASTQKATSTSCGVYPS